MSRTEGDGDAAGTQATPARRGPKARFAFTLVVRIATKLLNGLFNAVALPLLVEVALFGAYSYVLRVGSSLYGLLAAGNANQLLTDASTGVRSGRTLAVCAVWNMGILAVLAMIVLGADAVGRFADLFGEAPLGLVAIAMMQVWFEQSSLAVVRFGEAKAETFLVQSVILACTAARLAVLGLAVWTGRFDMDLFIAVNCAAFIAVSGLVLAAMRRRRQDYFAAEDRSLREVLRRYRAYCSNYGVYALVSSAYVLFFPWWLLRNGGLIEVAYFNAAFQWMILTTLPVTSVGNVFWREVSAAHAAGDAERELRILRNSVRFFTLLGGAFAVLAVLDGPWLIRAVFGGKYDGAIPVVLALCPYAVLLGVEMLTGFYLNATGRVRRYRNINILTSLLGILLVIATVGGSDAALPGLGLGAVGVSLSVVLCVLSAVVLQALAVGRGRPGLARAVILPVSLALAATWTAAAGRMALPDEMPLVLDAAIASGLSLALVAGLSIAVHRRPELAGLTRQDFERAGAAVRRLVG